MSMKLNTYLKVSLHPVDCKVLYRFSCQMKSTLVVFPRWISMLSLVYKWMIDVVNVYVNGYYFLSVWCWMLLKSLRLFCNQEMNAWKGLTEMNMYMLAYMFLSWVTNLVIGLIGMSQLRRTSCASCEVERKFKLDVMTCICAWLHKSDSSIQPSYFLRWAPWLWAKGL